MYALVHPFVEIALLRKRPQDLPWSPFLMWLILAAHVLLGTVMLAFGLDLLRALAAGLVGTALLVAMTVSLLYVNRLQTRATQTVTALAGTDIVIGVVALPITAWLQANPDQSAAGGLPGLLFLLLLGWNLAVTGHVLRHALNAPYSLGIVISLVFFVLSKTVLHALFPGVG